MDTRPEVTSEPRACSAGLSRAFGFLGKRWNGVLIGTLASGPAGYAELKRSVAGISDSMLSDRLNELTSTGLAERTVDPGPPLGVTYQLTAVGRGLIPALEALATWGERSLPEARCPSHTEDDRP